eukprot:NODE_1938_length_2330_cov_15.204267.p1 GENE.NODE_1938_length_2330_cov_15.204267~~NODE_1938_length_2330_cov_15.204267.p1  ORF type:complete len:747 (-),score=223.41 NODE_1938_length_2330_cov_15.204267:88-2136(-)
MSLPELQNLMKRDPPAYEAEFDQQWQHFESMMEIFKLKPQKPHKSVTQQVMFLAHVAPSFPTRASALPDILISFLDESHQVMHPEMRMVLVQALILLRNRDQFPCVRTLPLYFRLFALQDKELRRIVFGHIINDVMIMHHRSRNQRVTTELRDFFFAQLRDSQVELARRACAFFLSLYRKNVWRDAHAVNLMSAGLMHPDLKIAAALAHLFLGNQTKGLVGILEDSDNSDAEDVGQAVKELVASKKTRNKEKKIERAKKTATKALLRKKKNGDSIGISYVAIDMLHDAQTLAESLLGRVSKTGEPYQFRILLLHLIARLVSRHQLQIVNLYPFLIRYLNPKHRDVTRILACLIESAHSLVPPELMRPVVQHLIEHFVSEAMSPEVIEIGLNTIREISTRAVHILTEDQVADLAGFQRFKNKGVTTAARAFVKVFREVNPQLLHRSLRGREAQMAISRGKFQAPEFARNDPSTGIDGLDLLVDKWEKDEHGGEDVPEGEVPRKSEQELAQIISDRVLSAEDFQRLKRLRLQRSIKLQMGGKRAHDQISSDSSDGESDNEKASDDSDGSTDDEKGLSGRLPGAVAAGDLVGKRKKKQTKAQRMTSAASGRTDWNTKLQEKQKARKGGKTNLEHNRAKPHKMVEHSKGVQKKKMLNARQKVKNFKDHIKTMKKKVGGKCKRRRIT